ncbi:MAG TPA: hypothetical protein VJW94_10645 [Candidatus Acidoferrum sp.]|nr:hypothetical protein [Candidatus Acidoferrum sp.]
MEKQINLVQAALGQARSWHISSTFAANDGIAQLEEDVSCPFNYHRVGKVPQRLPNEIIAMQAGFYTREGERWTVLHPAAKAYCADGPAAGFAPLAQSLERLKGPTTLKKGEIQTIGGSSCRNFEFIGVADPQPKWGSLCIDEQTNLPHEFRYGKDAYQYSKWNEPIEIEPPPLS